MGDYWSEHNFEDLGQIEDVMDFVRRMVTGQLPEHWHLGKDFRFFSRFKEKTYEQASRSKIEKIHKNKIKFFYLKVVRIT